MIEVEESGGRALAEECPACGQYRTISADVRALDRAWRSYYAIRAFVAFAVGVVVGVFVGTLLGGCTFAPSGTPAGDAGGGDAAPSIDAPVDDATADADLDADLDAALDAPGNLTLDEPCLPTSAECDPTPMQPLWPMGLTCRLTGGAGDGRCRPIGPAAAGAQCGGVDDCGANMTCVGTPEGIARCFVVCDPVNPSARCEPDEVCTPFVGAVGLCR